MNQMATVTQLAAPKLTNASKLLVDGDCKSEFQFVRVINKTANIFNGPVLLRRHVDIPDGFYDINIDGSLSLVRYPYGTGYPDMGAVKPPFKEMAPSCLINSSEIGKMKAVADEVFKKRGTLVIDKDSMFCEEDRSVGLAYPFKLTFPIRLNPRHFSIIMLEMLQYPQIKFLRDVPTGLTQEPENVVTPLVIGVDWGSCALIKPHRGYYHG